MQDAMPLAVKGRTKLGNKRDSVLIRIKGEKALIAELLKLKRSCHMNA